MDHLLPNWNGFAASVPGSGHIRKGIPCQDASAVLLGAYPGVIVCDGRGSAALSHLGANGAVEAFRRQTAILTPFLVNILDKEDAAAESWDKFCRILYRTLMQVKLDLAAERECAEKEFDFTVVLALCGKEKIGFFQVGDGALVVQENGTSRTVFLPDKGEFANQTHFLRVGGEERGDFHAALLPAQEITALAATSDGPEHLMFQLAEMQPGKIFDCLFDDLAHAELCHQDLMDYLTRKEWNNDPRGADDRSIAIIARQESSENVAEPLPETAENAEPDVVPPTKSANAAVYSFPPAEWEVRSVNKSIRCDLIALWIAVTLLLGTLIAGIGIQRQSNRLLAQEFRDCRIHLDKQLAAMSQSEKSPIPEISNGVEQVSTVKRKTLPDAGAKPADSTISSVISNKK